MGLGTLTIGSDIFLDIGQGRYIDSTVQFGGPRKELRFTPGRPSKKAAQNYSVTSTSITYLWDAVVFLPDGSKEHRPFTATLQLQVPEGVTVVQVDSSTQLMSDLVTEQLLNRLLSGAS